MSLIYKLADIIEDSRNEYENILFNCKENVEAKNSFQCIETYGNNKNGHINLLAKADNLEFMKYLLNEENVKGNVKLIYVDPPFFSKADYSMQVKINSEKPQNNVNIKQTVYTDSWKEGIESYLRMICIRLYVMRDLLSEEGCIWMHLDWHVAHYVKILMDEVFGLDNFVNEVIWNYKSGGSSQRRFSRKHDTLLFYSKSNKYFFQAQKEKSYNRGFKPYRFKGVEEFQDEIGWYTLVNMKDVWQMDMLGRTSSERTGYATQKPEALLERILMSCSKEGDLCVDFFGGSGTLAITANKMNRRWLTSDIGKIAVAGIRKRLLKVEADFSVVTDENTKDNATDIAKDIDADIDAENIIEKEEPQVYIAVENCENKQQKLVLTNYKLNSETLSQVDKEDKDKLEEIEKTDSLCLVDYWSVDFNYNGETHRPQIVNLRNKDIMETCAIGTPENGVISVSCVDVFGNTSQVII